MTHSLKIGDILESSWGYDQTNVDFYKVIGVSPTRVRVVKVKAQSTSGASWGTGTKVPVPDAQDGDPMWRKVHESGPKQYGVRIASYAWARLWDGRPANFTEYA